MLGKIRCIATEIYSILGTGHNEIIYHKAMELELRNMQVPYVSKAPVSIYYKNHIVGYHEPDIILYNNSMIPDTIIELKASANRIRAAERAQLLSYMRNLKCERGILINFPQPSNKNPDLNDSIKNETIKNETIKNIDFYHVGFYLLEANNPTNNPITMLNIQSITDSNIKQIPCVDLNDKLNEHI